MLNAHTPYCTKMMECMAEKSEKTRMHSVFLMGRASVRGIAKDPKWVGNDKWSHRARGEPWTGEQKQLSVHV